MEFFYDLSCPFAYAASVIIKNHKLVVTARPVLLGALYEATNAPQGKAGSASDVMAPSKRALFSADMLRTRERNAVELRWPDADAHPQSTVLALRTILTLADEADRQLLTHALYRTYWVDNARLDEAAVQSVVARVFGARKPSMRSFDAAKDELRRNTDAYLSLGGFGVPGFVVNGQLYWGSDRLFMAVAALNPALPLARPLRLAPKWDGVSRKLTFYFDLSSPWSYLGSTQVARVARECHAQLELCPILLGALFRDIGTRNTPMDGLSDAKRAMASIDMERWRRWWGLALPVQFPDAFPLRTVTPQRVCIVEPNAMDALYTAAWTQNKNIGDEAILLAVLDAAGFNGAALLQRAAQDSVKEQLRRNTERAKAAGACGVPSYQVDGGAIIWGQDRLNVVEDLLCGWRDPVTAVQAAPPAKL